LNKFIGIDVGLRWLIMTNDGNAFTYPRYGLSRNYVANSLLSLYCKTIPDYICIEDLDFFEMGNIPYHTRDKLFSAYMMLESGLCILPSKIIKVAPHYSSQECSRCGNINDMNRLSQSEFLCLNCGLKGNADINAARNIRKRGMKLIGA
jgi:transposase